MSRNQKINNQTELSKRHERIKMEAIGRIIENTKILELKLESLLTSYINPPKNRFMFVKEIVFSNSFLSFGAKVKLFKYINTKENWLSGKSKKEFYSKIQSVIDIRNAFAHYAGSSEYSEGKDGIIFFDYRVKYSRSEKFEPKTYIESIKKFEEDYDYVFNKIVQIWGHIDNLNS